MTARPEPMDAASLFSSSHASRWRMKLTFVRVWRAQPLRSAQLRGRARNPARGLAQAPQRGSLMGGATLTGGETMSRIDYTDALQPLNELW